MLEAVTKSERISFAALVKNLPDYASDLGKNLTMLAGESILSPQQRAGAFLVSAMAVRHAKLAQAFTEEFANDLSQDALQAAQTIAAIMPVYNLYYRFAGLSGVAEYDEMPLKLRLSSLSKINVPEQDSELWIVAVSAVNACASCLKAHEPAAREAGASAQQIQAVVRIAAVISALATVLDSGQK